MISSDDPRFVIHNSDSLTKGPDLLMVLMALTHV